MRVALFPWLQLAVDYTMREPGSSDLFGRMDEAVQSTQHAAAPRSGPICTTSHSAEGGTVEPYLYGPT